LPIADAVVTKADDVRNTIAVEIDNDPRMLVHAPASVEAEEVLREPWRAEATVAIVDRRPGAIVAEPNDVRVAVVVEVDDKARVLIDAPTLLHAEICEDGLRGWFAEGAVGILEGH
jgi:hypothetical protein